MGLIDLGNGVKMADPQDFIPPSAGAQLKSALTLSSLMEQHRNAPLRKRILEGQAAEADFQRETAPARKEKLLAEAKKAGAEAVTKQADAFKAVALLGAEGNYGGATALLNKLLPGLGGEAAVIRHQDPQLAARGAIHVIHVGTGKVLYSQNPFADKAITKDIEMRADLYKQKVLKGIDKKNEEEKWVRTEGSKISENLGVSMEEGFEIAADGVRMSKSMMAENIFGKGQKGRIAPIASLETDQIKGVLAQREVVDTAVRRPGSKYGGRTLRKKADLNKEQKDNMAAAFQSVQEITTNLLPMFAHLTDENSAFGQPGILGGTLGALKSKFSQGDPEFEVLSAFSRQTMWSKLVDIAGTTFTEEIKEELQKLVPNEDDPLDVAVAKAGALLASTISLSHNKIDTWEATGHYTGELRTLLDPNSESILTSGAGVEGVLGNLADERTKRVAQTVLVNIPQAVKEDGRLMGLFVSSMPAPLQEHLNAELAEQGLAPVESAIDLTSKWMNLGQGKPWVPGGP